jgi:hypothetical protein
MIGIIHIKRVLRLCYRDGRRAFPPEYLTKVNMRLNRSMNRISEPSKPQKRIPKRAIKQVHPSSTPKTLKFSLVIPQSVWVGGLMLTIHGRKRIEFLSGGTAFSELYVVWSGTRIFSPRYLPRLSIYRHPTISSSSYWEI